MLVLLVLVELNTPKWKVTKMFLELVTKICIVVSAVSMVKVKVSSPEFATNFAIVVLALSFIRDWYIRRNEIFRILPTFGFWWVTTYLILLPLMPLSKTLTGQYFFNAWETVFATSVYAFAFRAFLIVNEGASRAIMTLLGFDNKRLDRAQRIMEQRFYGNVMNRGNSCVVNGSCGVNNIVQPEQGYYTYESSQNQGDCPRCGAVEVNSFEPCWNCGLAKQQVATRRFKCKSCKPKNIDFNYTNVQPKR